MSSVQSLREFISERLTAAAEEIFTEFEKTVVRYEEEIDRQRRLLDISWKPQINLHRVELQQHDAWEEEEVLTYQQLCDQERNSSLEQEEPEASLEELEPPVEEPESPQMKVEQEEHCVLQDEDHLELKQETDTFMVSPTYEERDQSEPEPNRDQLLSQNYPEAENQDQDGSRNEDSGSVRDEELRLNERRPQTSDPRDNVDGPELKQLNNPHTGENQFTCHFCGKHFSKNYNLRSHMRVHTGEKPFSCQTCGKSFSQSGVLKNHIRTHTGEKPYSCLTCGKGFKQRASLTYHIRTHTGENMSFCEICGKCFSYAHRLIRHMTTHTGEKKPFSCQTCGKSFSYRRSLTDHLKTHR